MSEITMYDEVCDFQDKLKNDEVLMVLFPSNDDPEILTWERDNDVCAEIGNDNGYQSALYVFNKETSNLKIVWELEKGWVK